SHRRRSRSLSGSSTAEASSPRTRPSSPRSPTSTARSSGALLSSPRASSPSRRSPPRRAARQRSNPRMFILIVLIHVLVSLIIIGLVLLQSGKGADIGSAFRGAGSHAVFCSLGTPPRPRQLHTVAPPLLPWLVLSPPPPPPPAPRPPPPPPPPPPFRRLPPRPLPPALLPLPLGLSRRRSNMRRGRFLASGGIGIAL